MSFGKTFLAVFLAIIAAIAAIVLALSIKQAHDESVKRALERDDYRNYHATQQDVDEFMAKLGLRSNRSTPTPTP